MIENLDYEVLSPDKSISFDPASSVSILVIIVGLYYIKKLGDIKKECIEGTEIMVFEGSRSC